MHPELIITGEGITLSTAAILSHQEKHALWERAVQGDQRARDALILAHAKLVLQTARNYAKRCQHLTSADLYQEGIMGLMKAISRYKLGQGANFTTYAMIWIQQAIGRAIADQEDTIRVPVYIRGKARTPDCVSLETPLDDDGQTWRDILPAPEEESHGSGVNWPGIFARANLTDREIAVMMGRYGSNGATLEEVGKRLGISRERVRQNEGEAMGKIRAVVGSRADEASGGAGVLIAGMGSHRVGATRRGQGECPTRERASA